MPDNASFYQQSDMVGGKLSPRGRHFYPSAAVWSCTGVVAWTGFFMGFFAIVMVGILYFNWTGGNLTSPTGVRTARLVHEMELLQRSVASYKDEMQAHVKQLQDELRAASTTVTKVRSMEVHNGPGAHRKVIHFSLPAKLLDWDLYRWPPLSPQVAEAASTETVPYPIARVTSMDLCCQVPHLIACASTSSSVIVSVVEADGSSYLKVLAKGLAGGMCTFTWIEDAPPTIAQKMKEKPDL